MRPSGVTCHVRGGTPGAARTSEDSSASLSVALWFRLLLAKPANRGASSVTAAAGMSRGARAPGQMPQPSPPLSDPSGAVSSGPQQGAGDSGEVLRLAGHSPQDMGFSGPQRQGRRMSACATLNSARTSMTVEKTRPIGPKDTSAEGRSKCGACAARSSGVGRARATASSMLASQPAPSRASSALVTTGRGERNGQRAVQSKRRLWEDEACLPGLLRGLNLSPCGAASAVAHRALGQHRRLGVKALPGDVDPAARSVERVTQPLL